MEQNVEKLLKQFSDDDIKRYQCGIDIPPILRLLKLGALDKKRLASFTIKRCELAHFFEDQLRFMIAVIKQADIPDDSKQVLLGAVEKNLSEELGELPQYGRAHKKDRSLFMSALGVNYEEWSREFGEYDHLGAVHPATKFILTVVRSLIRLGPIAAVTVLWYWENRLARGGHGEFFIFLEAFENQFPEFRRDSYHEGDVLWWIRSHANHDAYHAQLAANALQLVGADRQLVAWTLKTIDNLFELYWYLLERV